MVFDLTQYTTILASTPKRLSSILTTLNNSDFLQYKPTEDHFSIVEILGHIIYGEQVNWIPRLQLILNSFYKKEDLSEFTPFDRRGHLQLLKQHTTAKLIDKFSDLRLTNINILQQMTFDENILAAEGIHPSLGTVTVQQLLNTWVVHDLSHLNQINRILTHKFTAVGPWKEYLRILNN